MLSLAPKRRGSVVVAMVAIGLFLCAWVPSFFGPYGYFIDELYYLACAKRPAFGYVDHPPLSIWLLTAWRFLFGDSLPALRFLPALAGAATVWLTGALARRFGAGPFAQGLAALAVMLAPIPLIMCGFYSMNCWEVLLQTAAFYLWAELLVRDQPQKWLLFGLLAGIGLLNKHTFVLLGAAVGAAVVFTPARRHLRTPWPWLGMMVAALLVLPNLLWQISNDWPSLEFYRNADLFKNVPTPPLAVLGQQILYNNPGAFPVWCAGLVFFLHSRAGRPYRALGWACLLLLLLLALSQKSRPDRIAGIYPTLFAAGAVWLEAVARQRGLAWIKATSVALVVVCGGVFLPLGIPFLPPDQLARYAAATGVVPQIERGAGKVAQLPQWFADRLDWESFVADVEAAVQELTPEDRAQAVIVVPSYGHAGALELFGSPDLPPILSTQNTYFLWSRELLQHHPVNAGLAVAGDPEDLHQLFAEVERVRVHRCTYCMPWRSALPIYRVRGAKSSFAEAWPQFKHYE